MKKINLQSIRIDGGTQPRVAINLATVEDYRELIRSGVELPPVVVFGDGSDHWLGDGFHRWHAYSAESKASIPADVRAGTQRDAILFSVGANAEHGLRRSNEDKRKAARTLLEDAEWSKWSDTEIARRCAVSHEFVRQQRASLATVASEEPAPATRTVRTKHGTETTMNVSNIGKAKAHAPAEPPAQPPAVQQAGSPAPDGLEDEAPSEEEILALEQSEAAALELFKRAMEAADPMAAALAEVKRLTAVNVVLRSRVDGLLNQNAELVRRIKSLQRQAEKV